MFFKLSIFFYEFLEEWMFLSSEPSWREWLAWLLVVPKFERFIKANRIMSLIQLLL